MAHPHAHVRSPHVARAHKVMHRAGYASGGAVHDDAAEDAHMIERGVHEHEAHMHRGEAKTKLRLGDGVEGHKGRSHLAKRARGGKTGKNTKVQVIVAPQGGGAHPVPVPVAAHPPMPAAPPQAMPPRPMMGAPVGMGPGAGPAPMMRKRGGKVVHEEAGAMSGVGRIDKVHEYGSGRGFKPKKVPLHA